MKRISTAAAVPLAFVLTIAGVVGTGWSLHALDAPAKPPRVRPQQVITVKLYPSAHYREKAGDAPYDVSTVSETGCTVWLPVSSETDLEDELKAYRACRAALFDLHKVP